MIEIKKINKIMYKLSASFFIYFYFFIFYYYLFFKFDSYNGRESLNLKCHEHIKNIAYVCTTSIRSAPQFLNYIATHNTMKRHVNLAGLNGSAWSVPIHILGRTY